MQDVDAEVIVLDDASEDGSAEAIAEAFPDTRVLRSDRRLGYIAQRNRGAQEARAPVFTTFDDDAVFISRDTLRVALACFDHPRIGAVTLPTIDIPTDMVLRNRAPDGEGVWMADTFPGAASLLRRDVYQRLGGYREELFHRGEESEYSRRMFAKGWVVRLSAAVEVHHFPSVKRRLDEDVFGQARAQALQTAWALPARAVARRAAASVGHGVRNGHPLQAVRGLASGARAARRTRDLREPLGQELARAHRRMERERIQLSYSTQLADLEPLLPPLPD